MSHKVTALNQMSTGSLRITERRLLWIRNTTIPILLLIMILLPRMLGLDRLVTPDETRWLTRSANFYYALAHHDFAATFQIEHPGVVTMWAGTFALLFDYPAYRDVAPGQFNWVQDDLGAFLSAHGYAPLDLLVASRLNMILVVAFVLVAAFAMAARLFGFWPATIGFLLIAVDPFHTALSRLLHVDGMSSSLMLLALLAFLSYQYRGKRWFDLALSGIATGMAWLTKSPSLFLIPFIGLLLSFEVLPSWSTTHRLLRENLWRALFPLILWGGVSSAVFVLLWPAMWVEPVLTLRHIGAAMISYAAEGHESLLYFNGKIYTGDPGASFYPITYLWRSTPVVLVGLILTVFALAAPRAQWITPTQRKPLIILLLFAVLFTLFMTLGAKKFDRYLLPVYAPLDLVAGVGWVAATDWIRKRGSPRLIRVVAPAMLLIAFFGQAVCTVSSYPYYFSYYNPLLGGTRRAPEVMMVGWGEGLDQAARFLNSQPDAAHQQVVTGVWTTTFSYLYKGRVVRSRFEPGTFSVEDWMNSDYYVMYINEKQRDKVSHDVTDYFAALQPVKVININGLDYVFIYDLRDLPPPIFLRLQSRNPGGQLEIGSVAGRGTR